jgi:phospholipase C
MINMRSVVIIGCLFLLFSADVLASAKPQTPIQNVVVLMLENRSFDHYVGYLKQTLNPNIDGLTGNEYNLFNPQDPNSKRVYVNNRSPLVSPNPGHQIPDATLQIFGKQYPGPSDVPNMSGFVASAEGMHKGWGVPVMEALSNSSVSVTSALASEFALFDRWFSSVPGPTEINRMYLLSGTSHGLGYNDPIKLAEGMPQRTYFDEFHDQGLTWKIYFDQFPTAMFLKNLRSVNYMTHNYGVLGQFEQDAAKGNLPQFSFIEPAYFSIPLFPANDQHPSHDISHGEVLIKRIYTALRNSPQWNSTLFIVTFDEHGGFYDHVTPPMNVPNPDGMNANDPVYFGFDRLGVRVPTLMISPWINKGTLIHEPESGYFDHTSVYATLRKMFNLPNYLTQRDKYAATFESVLLQRSSPRTDCPTDLPNPKTVKTLEMIEMEHSQDMNDLQRGFSDLAANINGLAGTPDHIKTEHDGAKFVKKQMDLFFGRHGVKL